MKMASREETNRMFKAFNRYLKVYGLQDDDDITRLKKFAEFTGDPFNGDRGILVNTDNPKVMAKVDLILGPNGYTLLKMWKIQNDADTLS